MADRRATFFAGQQWYFRWLYRFGWMLVIPLTRLYTRMSINGREHIPESGPFILAPIHRSYVDTPIAGCVTSRRMRFMGKDSMWKIGWVGKLFSALGAFPIHRGSVDREAMKRSLAALEAGDGLVLFPEGERKSGPAVQPLLDGAIYLAVKAGVPIIPVGIGGSEAVMPKGAKFVYPKKVHIEIGPPIMPPGDGGRVPRTEYTKVAEQLSDELQRLFNLAMTRVPWDY